MANERLRKEIKRVTRSRPVKFVLKKQGFYLLSAFSSFLSPVTGNGGCGAAESDQDDFRSGEREARGRAGGHQGKTEGSPVPTPHRGRGHQDLQVFCGIQVSRTISLTEKVICAAAPADRLHQHVFSSLVVKDVYFTCSSFNKTRGNKQLRLFAPCTVCDLTAVLTCAGCLRTR